MAILGLVVVGVVACDKSSGLPDSAVDAKSDTRQGPWIEGVHFVRLEAAGHSDKSGVPGEVIEVFSYECPSCYTFEPTLVLWERYNAKKLGLDLVRVPMTTQTTTYSYSHLFYTLQALDRDDLHCVVYDTIHRGHNSLVAKTGDADTLKLQAEFATKYGIPRDRFIEIYTSPQISEKVAAAASYSRQFRVARTPAMVINRQYKTDLPSVGGDRYIMAIVQDLARDSQ